MSIYLIFYFENARAQLSLIYKKYDSDDGLASSEIFDINQDRYGQFWFGTNQGLSTYNFKIFKNWGIKEGLPNDLVSKILFDKQGKMWVLTLTKGIYYFDEKRQFFFEAEFNIELIGKLKKQIINQIVFDEQNILWFIVNNQDVYNVNNNKLSLVQSSELMSNAVGFFIYKISNNLRLYGVLPTNIKKASLFKINETDGFTTIMRYDKPINILGPVGLKLANGDELICYKNDLIKFKNNRLVSRFHLGNAFVMRVYEDLNSNVWLCTQSGGLFKFDDGILNQEHCQQFFQGQNITNLFIDKNEKMWLGTVGSGCYYISHGEIMKYLSEKKINDISIINDGLMAADQYGKLYEFSYNRFVEKFKNEQFEPRQIIEFKNKPLILYSSFNTEIKNNKTLPVILAKSAIAIKGKIYAIVNTLFIYDRNLVNRKQVFFPAKTLSIIKANEFSMLIGTQKGLYKFTINGEISPFLKEKEFQNYPIKTLGQDSINYYFSIPGRGFYLINKKNLQVDSIFKDWFHNDFITSVFIEDNYNIWICSNRSCYNFKYSLFRKKFYLNNEFSIKNGIINGDINKILIYKGFYFVATTKGIYKIPLKYRFKVSRSLLYFEKLTSKSTIYLNHPAISHTIFPSKLERTLEVQFSNSTFYKTEPAYRYRLTKNKSRGIWNSTNSELIQLSNLTNGNYKLEISNFNKTSNTAILNFKIPPLFNETTWYRLIWIISILGIFSLIIYQIFRNQKTLRNLAESRLLAMQTKLNPHFVFNSINSMQHLLFDQDFEKSNTYLTAFSALMRKCFEFSDKDFIPLNEEIKFIENYLQIEKLKKSFAFNITVSDEIDIFKTEIPPLFIQPIIENCIKHGFKNLTANNWLKISISIEKNEFNIKIENSGLPIQNNLLQRKDGSISLLNKRIEYLKNIYKNKNYMIHLKNENNITTSVLILPNKKDFKKFESVLLSI